MERGIGIAAMMVAAACGGRGGGAAKPAAKPLTVTPMSGPYVDVAAYCAAAADDDRARYPDEEDTDCWPLEDGEDRDELMPETALPRGATALAPPFTSARFAAVGFNGPQCHLVVETERGWYGASLHTACGYGDSRSWTHLELVVLAVEDLLPGGSPELVLRVREVETYANMDNDGIESHIDSETLLVCGVGPSGTPSCIEPLAVQHQETSKPIESDGFAGGITWHRAVEYRADAIVVSGGPPDRTGRHPIAFP